MTFLFSVRVIYSQIDGWNAITEDSDWITQTAERKNNLSGWFDLSETYHSPKSVEISLPSYRSGSANTFAALEKTFNLEDIIPNALTSSEYYISVFIKDNYTGSDSGFFFKQILVNNIIVWEDDISGNERSLENGWINVDVNVSDKIKSNKNVTITLCVYQKEDSDNFGVKTYWDNFVIHFDRNTDRIIRQNKLKGTMATYAGMGPVSFNGDDEGRTDEQDLTELVNEILYSNCNTYAFLFYYENDTLNKAHHWELFNDRILDSLLENDLKVWAYLVPPSESGRWKSEPYQTDYERWAQEIAGLSIENEGLTALAIDDFDGNLDGRFTPDFTTAYVQNFVSKMHDINPFLAFIPVSYYRDKLLRNQKRLNAYGNNFDAVLFPYLLNMTEDGINNYKHNIWNTTDLRDQIDEIKSNLAAIPDLDPDPLLIVDVYASSYYSTKPDPIVSTSEYVLEVGQKALDFADGVCYYLLQRERGTSDKEKRKREAIRTLFSSGFVKSSDAGQRVYVFTPGDQIITTTGSKENYFYSPYWFKKNGDYNFVDSKFKIAGDFDGDGNDEIAVFPNSAGSPKIFIYKAGTTSAGLPTYSLNVSRLDFMNDYDFNKLQYALAGDFNGNGKDEIAVFFNDGDDPNSHQRIFVYEKDKSKNKFKLLNGTEPGASWITIPESDFKILTGDFNGNRKDDIAFFYSGNDHALNQKIFVYEKHKAENKFVLLRGTENDGSWLNYLIQDHNFHERRNILVGDFNGNSIDDIAVSYDDGDDAASHQKILVYEKHPDQNRFVLLKGSKIGESRVDTTVNDHDFDIHQYSLAGDFDGDGIDEIAAFYDYGDSSDSRQRIFIYKLGSNNGFILTNGSEAGNSWFNQKLSVNNFDYHLFALSAQLYDEDSTGLNRDEIVIFYDKKEI